MNFIRLGGVVFLTMSIFSTKTDIEELYVSKNGKIIETIVISTPSNCNLRNNLTTFKCRDGEIFRKQMDKFFCLNCKVGDSTKFIVHSSYPAIYCIPKIENWLKGEILSGMLIFIFGIASIIYSFKIKKTAILS
jgi:hypothetical protein